MVVKCHCYVKVTLHVSCKLHLSIFSDFWKLVLKLKKTVVSKKRIHYSCEGRIENSVPQDHRLSSLGKPRDAKR